jgi:hypothetical protein
VVVVGVGEQDRGDPPVATQLSSSPITQTLLSTSKVCPSSENVPLVTP